MSKGLIEYPLGHLSHSPEFRLAFFLFVLKLLDSDDFRQFVNKPVYVRVYS